MALASINEMKAACVRALQLLLLPTARFCLRHHLSLTDVNEAFKRALLTAAREEIARSNAKVNASRLSVMTGIHRNEIVRISTENEFAGAETQSIAERVLGRWVSDKRFSRGDGTGRPLSYQGSDSEFYALVRGLSKNVNPAAVLFELIRSGRVEKHGDTLKPLRAVTQFGDDMARGFELVSRDIETLLSAVEENLRDREQVGNMHFHTVYDNVYVKDLPKLRKWIIDQGREFHRQLRAYIATFDKDVNPDIRDDARAGAKVSIVAVSHIQEPP